MTVNQQKLQSMIIKPEATFIVGALRREGSTFFIDGELPAKSSLEALFESHCQSPAELFCVTFRNVEAFRSGEELVGLIKKNFNAHVMGRFEFPPALLQIERAYAAGVDIIDIPLVNFDQKVAKARGLDREALLLSLEHAGPVFPRWSVVSTLAAGEEPLPSAQAGIDFLLAKGVVPLLELSERASACVAADIEALFVHLAGGWRRHKVTLKPLQPLIDLTMPLNPLKTKGLLRGIFDKIHEQKLLATADLRRNLRVQQIEQSLESAGL